MARKPLTLSFDLSPLLPLPGLLLPPLLASRSDAAEYGRMLLEMRDLLEQPAEEDTEDLDDQSAAPEVVASRRSLCSRAALSCCPDEGGNGLH